MGAQNKESVIVNPIVVTTEVKLMSTNQLKATTDYEMTTLYIDHETFKNMEILNSILII